MQEVHVDHRQKQGPYPGARDGRCAGIPAVASSCWKKNPVPRMSPAFWQDKMRWTWMLLGSSASQVKGSLLQLGLAYPADSLWSSHHSYLRSSRLLPAIARYLG